MAYSAIVSDDGAIAIPQDLLEELGWRVDDDIEIEHAEYGLVVRRRPDEYPTR